MPFIAVWPESKSDEVEKGNPAATAAMYVIAVYSTLFYSTRVFFKSKDWMILAWASITSAYFDTVSLRALISEYIF